MKKLLFSRVFRILVFLFLLIGIILGVFKINELIVLARISSKLNTAPNWNSIEGSLKMKEFKPGMTRENVHVVLDKLGPWETEFREDPAIDKGIGDPNAYRFLFREQIYFTEISTSLALGGWIFFYDEEGILVKQEEIYYLPWY